MNLRLPVFTPDEAALRGFQSITTPISRVAEAEIIASIDSSLADCEACWISVSKGHLEAARRASDLIKGGPNE